MATTKTPVHIVMPVYTQDIKPPAQDERSSDTALVAMVLHVSFHPMRAANPQLTRTMTEPSPLLFSTLAQLADFGCSIMFNGSDSIDEQSAQLLGSVPWMAPEAMQGRMGRKADIWSLGCTVVEMLTGRRPWPDFTNHLSLMYHVATSGKHPDIPEGISDLGRDFLEKCFISEVNDRWSARTLLTHDFVLAPSRPRHKSSRSGMGGGGGGVGVGGGVGGGRETTWKRLLQSQKARSPGSAGRHAAERSQAVAAAAGGGVGGGGGAGAAGLSPASAMATRQSRTNFG